MTKNEISIVDALEEIDHITESNATVVMPFVEPDGTPDNLYFQKGWDGDINVYDFRHDFLMSFSKDMKMSIKIATIEAYLEY